MTEEKNLGGRPPRFNTPEELTEQIDKYFERFSYNENGDIIGRKPTVAGLALELGFESRQSIYDYAEKGEFSYAIKRALLAFEAYHESSLSCPSTTGHIFWLKNHGWKDKTEVDNTLKVKPVLVEFSDDGQDNDTNEV